MKAFAEEAAQAAAASEKQPVQGRLLGLTPPRPDTTVIRPRKPRRIGPATRSGDSVITSGERIPRRIHRSVTTFPSAVFCLDGVQPPVLGSSGESASRTSLPHHRSTVDQRQSGFVGIGSRRRTGRRRQRPDRLQRTVRRLPAEFADAPVIDHRPGFLLPGFIDTHVHFPQTYSGDSYGGGQLLEWLNSCIFPAESRFADPDFAAAAAVEFCDAADRGRDHGRRRLRFGLSAGPGRAVRRDAAARAADRGRPRHPDHRSGVGRGVDHQRAGRDPAHQRGDREVARRRYR